MSINNIELGDWIVSELYRDSLLATETPYISAHPLTARPSTTSAETAPAPGPMPATGVEQSAVGQSSSVGQQAAPAASGQRAPSGQEIPPPAQTGASQASPAPAPAKPGLASLAATVHGKSTPADAVPPGATGTNAPARPASSPNTQASSLASASPNTPAGSPNIPAGSPGAAYKFLGTNRRHITILVQSPGVAFLPDDQLNFLTRMLEACKMNVGDVAIVNQATTPVNITALKQQLQPATLLLFGMEPVDIRLPMNFPAFKIQDYDGCTYLSAPSLHELVQPGDESKLLKSKLWICLKTIFGI